MARPRVRLEQKRTEKDLPGERNSNAADSLQEKGNGKAASGDADGREESLSLRETLERQNKKLSILYEIALTVGKSLDLKTVLDDVLRKIIAFTGVDSGAIFIINDETLELVPASLQNLSEEAVKDICGRNVKIGECLCGRIAEGDREVIIFEKASKDLRFACDFPHETGIEFYAGLPLKSKGKVIGVLCVIGRAPLRPDEDLADILRAATFPISLAIENARLFEDAQRVAEARLRYCRFEGIVANSPKMKEVLSMVRKVTDAPSSILIYGESGTGKELIARAIHFNSTRKDKPFIAVNCAAIPETLLESELFGYVKGAFTGASSDKKGLFEAADGGTILLDEVEAMTKNLQVKLLRVLQDRTFFKVGSAVPFSVDVRVLAATNQELEEEVKAKRFREDLYYRLNVIKIDLPPLRERAEDIPLLIRYFISRHSQRLNKSVRRASDEVLDILLNHSWPGNIRELENMIERAVVVAETDEIRKEDLPIDIATHYNDVRKFWSLENVEREHILKILTVVRGNKSKAARLLGLDVTTLWRKLKKYGISG
ncbi:MAG: sigma 54-interacting transcriptional regulator [Nitrospirae bacterium]|nr:sigma 54-interacting transcriptional regulator [Nitrospirota bacterium]